MNMSNICIDAEAWMGGKAMELFTSNDVEEFGII